MAGTKLLPTNAARPQAAPLKHQGTPADPRHCQGRQHRTQSLDCKTPHPNQPSHLLGILTGKLKAPNRDRLLCWHTYSNSPTPFFLRWVMVLEFPDLTHYSPTKGCISLRKGYVGPMLHWATQPSIHVTQESLIAFICSREQTPQCYHPDLVKHEC